MSDSTSSESHGFSAEVERLVATVRALVAGHVDLLRAELGAIAREAVAALVGAIAIVVLLVAALLGLLVAFVLIACAALFGSVLWGVAQMTLLLLVIAAAIAANVLRIEARRRRRSLALATVGGAVAAVAAVTAFHADASPAAGLSVTVALSVLLFDLLAGLRTFDLQRFTDRFVPLASEAELRATLAALDGLRAEAVAGVAEEVGTAAANADATLDAVRGAASRFADAVKGFAERRRSERADD
jgi:uncharacterized membrane protein YqjE